MRTLIVGIGALGGTIAARALGAGMNVSLATRTAEAARALRSSGLRLSGVGGAVSVRPTQVAALAEYERADKFDLIVLATKAHDALELAPFLAPLLTSGGTLLCIQNGGVAQLLSDRLGGTVVLGGLSNLGATMVETGVYEQRNAGHLLIGELEGGNSERASRIALELGRAVEARVTENLRGAIWAKLLLNCSVTTIGAIAGRSMREYIRSAAGVEVFRRAYEEALSVSLAAGTWPQKMIVDPLPPGWQGDAWEQWLRRVLDAYGDLKPSMLQDFERRRRTEIDFINGYVAALGRDLGVPVAMNTAIADAVHRIEQGRSKPDLSCLDELLRAA